MSPFRVLIILLLIIAVPFLIAMIIIYVKCSMDKKKEEGKKRSNFKPEVVCKNHRAAAMTRSIHEDNPDGALRFLCNGIITDIDTVRVPKECFADYSDESSRKKNHYVSGGSRFWTRELSQVHSISNIRYADNYDAITVTPPFDKCVLNKMDMINEKSNQSVVGWDTFSREARSELISEDIEDIKGICLSKPGALVFGPNGTFKGIVKKLCNENDSLIIFPDMNKFLTIFAKSVPAPKVNSSS